MTVMPFVFGVIAALAAEFVIVFIAVVIAAVIHCYKNSAKHNRM